MKEIRLLGISGSLRSGSSNTALLEAASLITPKGLVLDLYKEMGQLPHFNPDLEDELPGEASALRTVVGEADGLLISTPEYAHGLPGSLKNALDWLVGGPEFIEKPFALLNASSRSTYAQASLIETLTVMSGRHVTEATTTIPILGKGLTGAEIAADATMAEPLRRALERFTQVLRRA